jgi:hypothetical protein
MHENVFIVDSSPPVTTAPALGHERRTCDRCGADWGREGCTRSGCTSMEFTTRYIEPVPLMTRIQQKLAPKKPAPRAGAGTVSELRGLQGDAAGLLSRLERLEVQLIAEVRGGCEELAPVQGLIHECCYTSGDVSRGSVRLLTLALRALGAYLAVDVKNIEDRP